MITLVLVGSYKWPAVRAFHYKVLRKISKWALRLGGSPLIPSNRLFSFFPYFPESASKDSKVSSMPLLPKQPGNSPQLIPRNQICDAWTWYDDCNSPDCPPAPCLRGVSDYQVLACPKRKSPIPSCRSDAPTQD